MKKIVLLVLALFSVCAQAQEKKKILDCMQPVYLGDPSFQQGSEKFFDVILSEGKLEIFHTTGDLRRETILTTDTNVTTKVDFTNGTLYGVWQGSEAVQLVLRDFGTRWRGALVFPEGFNSKTLQIRPGGEVILACILK